MLDVVQRQRSALDADEVRAPGPGIEQRGGDIDLADRVHRVVVEHQADDQRVVEIEPEGELLVAGVLADQSLAQLGEIAIELCAVLRRDAAIIEAVDEIRPCLLYTSPSPRD